jgi:hypothetical protein
MGISITSTARVGAVAVLLAGTITWAHGAHGQWDYPDKRTPRTKDGKPNLAALAPRLNDKPDLSGLWQAERTPASEYNAVLNGFTDVQPDTRDITKNVVNIFWGMKPEDEPLRPEAAAIVKQRRTWGNEKIEPEFRWCGRCNSYKLYPILSVSLRSLEATRT